MGRVSRRGDWSAAALGALLLACSEFDGGADRAPLESGSVEPLNTSNSAFSMDAAMREGPSTGADWSCLGAPPASVPTVPVTENVSYSLPIRSLLGAPISNASAKVCLPADLACAMPLSEVRGLAADDTLVVQVPRGFNGFLELLVAGHVPMVFQMRRPVLRDTVDSLPLQPIPTAGLAQLAGLLNVEIVSELGFLGVTVVDCKGARAPGVVLSNNLGGRLFYFIDGVPSTSAPATAFTGSGGFANVPTRLVEVAASLASDGRQVGTKTVLPRVGWITVVEVHPAALPLE
jgi:hypothetical protein